MFCLSTPYLKHYRKCLPTHYDSIQYLSAVTAAEVLVHFVLFWLYFTLKLGSKKNESSNRTLLLQHWVKDKINLLQRAVSFKWAARISTANLELRNNSLLVATAQPTLGKFTWGLQKAHSHQQLLIWQGRDSKPYNQDQDLLGPSATWTPGRGSPTNHSSERKRI